MSARKSAGPRGYWCRACGVYLSTRDAAQARAAREHTAAHEAAGEEPRDGHPWRKGAAPTAAAVLTVRVAPHSHPVSGAAQRVVSWVDPATGKPRRRTVPLDYNATGYGYAAAVRRVFPAAVSVEQIDPLDARAFAVALPAE